MPVCEVHGVVDEDVRDCAPVEDLIGRGDEEGVAIDEDDDESDEGGEEGWPLPGPFLGLGLRLPEVPDVVAETADEDDGEDDEDPVLPGLEPVVPVEEHALGVDEIDALVEHVARADVVHAEADEDFSLGVGAREVLPAVRGDCLAVFRGAGSCVGHGLADVGRAEGPGARVAPDPVPGGPVEIAEERVGRVGVDGPEVDADGACAGQDKGRPALPPGDHLGVLGDGEARPGCVLQAEEGWLGSVQEQQEQQAQQEGLRHSLG